MQALRTLRGIIYTNEWSKFSQLSDNNGPILSTIIKLGGGICGGIFEWMKPFLLTVNSGPTPSSTLNTNRENSQVESEDRIILFGDSHKSISENRMVVYRNRLQLPTSETMVKLKNQELKMIESVFEDEFKEIHKKEEQLSTMNEDVFNIYAESLRKLGKEKHNILTNCNKIVQGRFNEEQNRSFFLLKFIEHEGVTETIIRSTKPYYQMIVYKELVFLWEQMMLCMAHCVPPTVSEQCMYHMIRTRIDNINQFTAAISNNISEAHRVVEARYRSIEGEDRLINDYQQSTVSITVYGSK